MIALDHRWGAMGCNVNEDKAMKIKLALMLAAFTGSVLAMTPASAAPVGAAGQSAKADQIETGLVEQVRHRRWYRHTRHHYRHSYAYRYRPRYYSSYSYEPYYYRPYSYRPYYAPYYSSYYSPYSYGYSGYYGGYYGRHFGRPGISIRLGF